MRHGTDMDMDMAHKGKRNRLSDMWGQMSLKLGDKLDRSERYARWTIPAVFPVDNAENVEQDMGSVDIGPKAVNHLANKIIDVLFPVSRAFFAVTVKSEIKSQAKAEIGKEQFPQWLEQVKDATTQIENAAMSTLKLSKYRPMAIEVAKQLIVVGDCVIRRMPDGSRVHYGLKRYRLRRNKQGEETCVLLYDKVRMDSLSEKHQDLIRETQRDLKPHSEVELYTHYMRTPAGDWNISQEAEGVDLQNDHKQSAADYDLICLAWTLGDGEDYGRGLVEDYATTFHKLDVIGEAQMEMMAILADIKFLVRPNSVLAMNIDALNDARRGTYHAGAEGDITVPQVGKFQDMQAMANAIAGWEQIVSDAFLISQVRDAERVTAEEIRFIASQLESAFGGLYSRLAVGWQDREAQVALEASNWRDTVAEPDLFEITVTSGLEALSREGQLDNLRLAIGDMQMLEAVPEEMRATFHPLRFARFVCNNRAVDLDEFLKTAEEMKAEQEAAMEQERAVSAQQAETNVSEYAGKAAVDQQQG